MSTKRKTIAAFFGRDTHAPHASSPPASPRLAAAAMQVPAVAVEERIMTSEELAQSVQALEQVLRTMDQVRDLTNRYNSALREHVRSLREYAVGINMIVARDDKAQRGNVGEDRVSERLLVHCANYYDRLAEAQEQLVHRPLITLIQARQFLEEYNILNNFAAKHFKTLARDNQNLDNTLKDLTKKLSKLTHKSAPPGTANTQNASTAQAPGVHELYVQRLTGLSGQIQQVRKDHLQMYTRTQKTVDRYIARSFARCCRQSYVFLADALVKTGGSAGIGGVTSWGVFANAGISPPVNELDMEGELEPDEEWEPSQDDEDEQMSQRQLAQSQPYRPPSSLTDHISPDPRGGARYGTMSVKMAGKQPASQGSFQAYPGSSQINPGQVSPFYCLANIDNLTCAATYSVCSSTTSTVQCIGRRDKWNGNDAGCGNGDQRVYIQ